MKLDWAGPASCKGSVLQPWAAACQFRSPLAEKIGKQDAKPRAALVSAYTLGIAVSRLTLQLPNIRP